MQGIFDRADELTQELLQEYGACAQRGEVSERAKNLFHEVLVKVRSALDFAMNRIYNVHSTLPSKKKTAMAKHVLFPICEQEKQFSDNLRKYGLSHLEHDEPDLYRLIRQPQPFATKRNDFLLLRELSNLGKHVQLAVQECKLQKGKKVTKQNGSVMKFTEGVTFHRNGIQVDPSVYGEVQDVTLASFDIHHGPIKMWEPHLQCLAFCLSGRRYINKLLALL